MKFKMRFIQVLPFTVIVSLLVFSGFSGDDKSKNSGFDLNNLDRAGSPAKDFYQFACGGWVKSHPIPDAQTRWGTFVILAEQNNEQIKKIVEAAAANKNWPQGSPEQEIGDFYATGMDSARIEKSG